MNLPAALFAVRWLIRDTFRQALASGLFWVMLAASAACTLLCLSIGVVRDDSLPPPAPGEARERLSGSDPLLKNPEAARQAGIQVGGRERLSLAFGAIDVAVPDYADKAVHFLQLLLAGAVADTAGVLLVLVWTAGFLPTFLDPGAASVLLAKPVPRWWLLAGKYFGVLVFVGFQASVFVGLTWFALGIKTGVWNFAYLLCVPLLLLHFSVFFSVSALLAVSTRSTVTCVLGSILFWFLSFGMNYGRHFAVLLPELNDMPGAFRASIEVGYWFLPKPADFNLVLANALHAESAFGRWLDVDALVRANAFLPELSVVTSLLFAVGGLGLAGREFATTDY